MQMLLGIGRRLAPEKVYLAGWSSPERKSAETFQFIQQNSTSKLLAYVEAINQTRVEQQIS